jgi:hypothetical protein
VPIQPTHDEDYVPIIEALWQRTPGRWFSYGDLATVLNRHFDADWRPNGVGSLLRRIGDSFGVPNRARSHDGSGQPWLPANPIRDRLLNERQMAEGLPVWSERFPLWQRLGTSDLVEVLADVLPAPVVYEAPPADEPIEEQHELLQRLATARAEADPLDRLGAMRALANDLQDVGTEVADEYALAAFLANRAGTSYTALAELMGVHSSRVGQLIARGRAVHERTMAEAL